jgi:hypothetical protein
MFPCIPIPPIKSATCSFDSSTTTTTIPIPTKPNDGSRDSLCRDLPVETGFRHMYDKSGSCAREGKRAEAAFERAICISSQFDKWTVRRSTRIANMREHIDFVLYSPDDSRTLTVDVKGRKRICRAIPTLQDEYLWLELHSPRKKGWLQSPNTDIIAVCVGIDGDTFVLFDRQRLLLHAYNVIDTSTTVSKPMLALNKIYNRRGQEQLSLIYLKDAIVHAACAIIS